MSEFNRERDAEHLTMRVGMPARRAGQRFRLPYWAPMMREAG